MRQFCSPAKVWRVSIADQGRLTFNEDPWPWQLLNAVSLGHYDSDSIHRGLSRFRLRTRYLCPDVGLAAREAGIEKG